MVEGVGDHGCEYMTGGRVVVLGRTGRNFGAGMSGGVAFVHDPDGTFPALVNLEMVDLDPLTDEDRAFLADRVKRHHEETDSAVAARLLADWTRHVRALREGDAPRLQGGAGGHEAGRGARASIPSRR